MVWLFASPASLLMATGLTETMLARVQQGPTPGHPDKVNWAALSITLPCVFAR